MMTAVALCLGEVVRWRRTRGEVSFRVGDRHLALRPSSVGAAAALRQLIAGGASAPQLSAVARRASGPSGAAEWAAHLRQLESLCAVSYELRDGAAVLLRAVPMQPEYRAGWSPHAPVGRVVLSRFAFLQRDNNRWRIESPLSLVRCEVHSAAIMVLVASLARPCTVHELAARCGLPIAPCRHALALLGAAGCVSPVASGQAREDRDPDLAMWEFADLLLHSRSRLGRHDRPVGAQYPFRGVLRPQPAVKRPRGGAVVTLDRLD